MKDSDRRLLLGTWAAAAFWLGLVALILLCSDNNVKENENVPHFCPIHDSRP
jgi:hypothetical protein